MQVHDTDVLQFLQTLRTTRSSLEEQITHLDRVITDITIRLMNTAHFNKPPFIIYPISHTTPNTSILYNFIHSFTNKTYIYMLASEEVLQYIKGTYNDHSSEVLLLYDYYSNYKEALQTPLSHQHRNLLLALTNDLLAIEKRKRMFLKGS